MFLVKLFTGCSRPYLYAHFIDFSSLEGAMLTKSTFNSFIYYAVYVYDMWYSYVECKCIFLLVEKIAYFQRRMLEKMLNFEIRLFRCPLHWCKNKFQYIDMFMHMFMSYFEHIKPNEVYTCKKFKDKLGPPNRPKWGEIHPKHSFQTTTI